MYSLLLYSSFFISTASSLVAWSHGAQTAWSLQQEEKEEGKERKKVWEEERKKEVEHMVNKNCVIFCRPIDMFIKFFTGIIFILSIVSMAMKKRMVIQKIVHQFNILG